jgi:hypothetical protein
MVGSPEACTETTGCSTNRGLLAQGVYGCRLVRMEDRESYTLSEAARILNTSEGALRQRIRRGTLESYKDQGRVYVYIPHTDNVQDDVHTPE